MATVVLRGIYDGSLHIVDDVKESHVEDRGWSGRPRLVVYTDGAQRVGDGLLTLYPFAGFAEIPPLGERRG